MNIATNAMAMPKTAIFSTVSRKKATWSRPLDCTASLQATGFTSEKKTRSSAIVARNVTTLPSKIFNAPRIRLPRAANTYNRSMPDVN